MPSVRPALVTLAAIALAACGNHGAPTPAGSASASSPSSQTPAPAAPLQPGTTTLVPSNPLDLPPGRVTLDPGKRVFTFTEQMLASARPGSTLVLTSATAAGTEGDDLIIEGHGGPSYKVHAGYVIAVPDNPKLRVGEPVITELGGLMRHAVFLKLVKDRVAVRFTDVEGRTGETLLPGGSGAPAASGPSKAARIMRQTEGLAPGNYAALRQGEEWLHVLLVSASGEGAERRWLALGYGGAAMLVAEAELRPIPVKWKPKVGSQVWAEHAGKMRRATVQSADEPGIYTVKYDRAGRPRAVGWGLLMAPLAPSP